MSESKAGEAERAFVEWQNSLPSGARPSPMAAFYYAFSAHSSRVSALERRVAELEGAALYAFDVFAGNLDGLSAPGAYAEARRRLHAVLAPPTPTEGKP